MRWIPFDLPQEMRSLIEELRAAKNKEQALKHAYNILTGRYKGQRLKTFTHFWKLFIKNPYKLWASTDFLHCTNMNFLLRILIVKSGWFTDEDIKPTWTFVWLFSPHQYLKIRLSESNYVNVDIWGAAHGISYGDYARGFH